MDDDKLKKKLPPQPPEEDVKSPRPIKRALSEVEAAHDGSADCCDEAQNRRRRIRCNTNTEAVTSRRDCVPCPIKLFATSQDLENRKKHVQDYAADHHHWSYSQCETLREVLGLERSLGSGCTTHAPTKRIDWIVISNYMIDFEFLLDQVPELISLPRVVIFYGCAETSPPAVWKHNKTVDLRPLNPADEPNSPSNPTSQRIPYGVHHSKFFLIGYNDDTMRVVVHTANLRYSDLYNKAQALYRQDFSLKTKQSAGPTPLVSSSPFESTLLDYLDTYKFLEPRVWRRGESAQFLRQVLKRFDFSTALVILIPSTPGYHRLDDNERRGHWKVRECTASLHPPALSASTQPPPPPPPPAPGSIICQFSSMGSLTEKYLREEFQVSFNSTTGRKPPLQKSDWLLKIVYPTVQEVRDSVEGYRGGASVPAPSRNVHKPFLRPFFCHWSTSYPAAVSSTRMSARSARNPMHKGNHVPHIKTYFQLHEDGKSMKYFILSSHNLSKAAWGEIQKSARHGGRRLFIRHWELGVFVTPDLLGCEKLVPWDEHRLAVPRELVVPLPFNMNPSPYGPTDQPWAVDEHHEIPDRFGRHSCLI
ncbi:hypothetical protein ACA910_014013 [Epithemia clementina (nom. ined.)]